MSHMRMVSFTTHSKSIAKEDNGVLFDIGGDVMIHRLKRCNFWAVLKR